MKLAFYLLDADYVVENGRPLVRLFGVDANGRSVCVLDTYEPYLYAVPKTMTKELQNRIAAIKEPKVARVEVVKRKLGAEERDVLKVYASTPSDVPNLRDALKSFKEIGHDGCYEYAVNFYRRYLIDRSLAPGAWYEVDGENVKSDWKFGVVVKAEKITQSKQTVAPKLRVLAFDLESYEEAGKPHIIMASVYGSTKRVFTYKKARYGAYVTVVANEKELIEKLIETINEADPDVLVTYNGDEFDFALLRERCDELKVKLVLSRDGEEVTSVRRMRVSSARLNGRVHLDLYALVNNVLKYHLDTETLTLDAVAAEILGDRKIELAYEQMVEAWRSERNLGKFAEYNLKDSELTFRLANEFLPEVLGIARVVGQPPFDVSRMSYSQLVEWHLVRRAHAEGRISPNQPRFDEIEARRARPAYVGGFVREPLGGIQEKIAVMDFRSLYPSIIASHNISPETLDCDCCKTDGYKVPGMKRHFCKKKQGFYSAAVRGLIEARVAVKERLQKLKPASQEYKDLKLEEQALKMVANASYGALAYTGAKWYCYECAEASAAFGRYYISLTMGEAEKAGFTVVYADTDSCFVKRDKAKDIGKSAAQFIEQMNKKLPGIMELELQGIYERGVFIPKGAGYARNGKAASARRKAKLSERGTAKKRYALIDSKGALTIRGLETVRRDWCELAKEVQRNVLVYVLKKKDKEGAIAYMKSVVERVRKKKVDIKELTIHEQLTKRLEEYKQIGPHVVAARKIKERGRPYGPGMIVVYVITEGKGSISQRAEPIEDASVERTDAEYYINNQIVPAGMRVLQVLGVTEEELKGMGTQATIRKFVKKV
ncbi:MAG: ribonuclease H-like domain-containing protein [Candidatus Aenigmatarchaeota archaeon]|nr:MAG: ribonuclease H-like domain-containing protein [Candidatus Aenigmarchaeota archaeon]